MLILRNHADFHGTAYFSKLMYRFYSRMLYSTSIKIQKKLRNTLIKKCYFLA